MTIDKFFEHYEILTKRKEYILKSKNHDYAKSTDMFSNFRKVADISNQSISKVFMVFMAVKIARLGELTTEKTPNNESVEDTLLDLSNYADLFNIFLKENIKDKDIDDYNMVN